MPVCPYAVVTTYRFGVPREDVDSLSRCVLDMGHPGAHMASPDRATIVEQGKYTNPGRWFLTPEFPWSDLVESEDGRRLTAPMDGRYVYGNSGQLKPAAEGETRIKIQWDVEPIQDEPPC